EYSETLIDPSIGNRLSTLRNALASFLLVTTDSIIILAIRPVYQYRTNASGPNPCTNYVCPIHTICRPTRTIQPLSYSIDTNQTSFVGINVVDSADCVNSIYLINFRNTPCRCITYPFNNLTYCPCISLQTYAPLGPYCQVLGRTFNENGGVTNSLISGLYPSLTQVDTFSGCIRNVLSNGYYLDMSKALVSVNSYYGQSSCTLTNPYTTTTRTSITTPTTTAGRGVHFVTFRFIQKLVAVVFIMNLN
ncbi:unnamed protein product, partial [Rotaria sp. Silwood1]